MRAAGIAGTHRHILILHPPAVCRQTSCTFSPPQQVFQTISIERTDVQYTAGALTSSILIKHPKARRPGQITRSIAAFGLDHPTDCPPPHDLFPPHQSDFDSWNEKAIRRVPVPTTVATVGLSTGSPLSNRAPSSAFSGHISTGASSPVPGDTHTPSTAPSSPQSGPQRSPISLIYGSVPSADFDPGFAAAGPASPFPSSGVWAADNPPPFTTEFNDTLYSARSPSPPILYRPKSSSVESAIGFDISSPIDPARFRLSPSNKSTSTLNGPLYTSLQPSRSALPTFVHPTIVDSNHGSLAGSIVEGPSSPSRRSSSWNSVSDVDDQRPFSWNSHHDVEDSYLRKESTTRETRSKWDRFTGASRKWATKLTQSVFTHHRKSRMM